MKKLHSSIRERVVSKDKSPKEVYNMEGARNNKMWSFTKKEEAHMQGELNQIVEESIKKSIILGAQSANATSATYVVKKATLPGIVGINQCLKKHFEVHATCLYPLYHPET